MTWYERILVAIVSGAVGGYVGGWLVCWWDMRRHPEDWR